MFDVVHSGLLVPSLVFVAVLNIVRDVLDDG